MFNGHIRGKQLLDAANKIFLASGGIACKTGKVTIKFAFSSVAIVKI